jgi:hypothetical protein
MPYVPYPLIRKTLDHLTCFILRSIVDDNDFEILKRLIQNALNSSSKKLGAVMCGNDDADSWHKLSVRPEETNAPYDRIPAT